MKTKWQKLSYSTIVLGIVFLFISSYLNLHTFSYNSEAQEIVIASRLWSDFGAHIPLIRSFSFGDNWPPEYPIFPGEKIRYHFLFYALVGLLERVGFRIDIALNTLSIFGFFLLLVMIYKLAQLIFQKKIVAILSVLFFLFNGSLSFLEFFKTHPLSTNTIREIISLNQFPSFGPWGGQLVTAFTNLNIYTNQRHLSLSFAIVLLIIYLLLQNEQIAHKIFKLLHIQKNKKTAFLFSFFTAVCIGFLAGSLFFFNHPALLISVIFCTYLFLFHPKTRASLLIVLLTTLPFLWYFFQIAQPGSAPIWEVGYLSRKPFELIKFLEFWLHNMGLHLILIPIGFFFAPKKYRFFFIPLLILFVLPNLYRFSVDMINNHKFFNFFMILGSMFTAQTCVCFWIFIRKNLAKLKKEAQIIYSLLSLATFSAASFIIFILTFSGVLDFFVIHNDYKLVLKDLPANKDALFITQNTPQNSVILNSTWMYHPASLAGRKIYNGYSFFTWSAGYDTYGRERITKTIYQSEDISLVCSLLIAERISYVELNNNPEEFLKPISTLWKTASPLYTNTATGVSLFETNSLCQKSL